MQYISRSVAITGSGGSGSVTAGMILLEALALKGLYGVMNRSYGPQIRGGESAVMIRFGTDEHQCQSDNFDVLLSLDWLKVDRFAEEIPLNQESLVLGDVSAGEVPEVLIRGGAKTALLGFSSIAKTIDNGRPNMLALGLLGAWIGLSADQLLVSLSKVLGKKSAAILDASKECILQGMEMLGDLMQPLQIPDRVNETTRWSLSGNEACAFGALLGGVRFVAAYPITPASDLLEWLAPRLEKVNGALLQAEDELASINMIIGASFGGVPSLTATSGPGLSLMSEALGLAVASEIPLVVVNVSRGGPSTGIPTKSEQSDLNIALYGLHGDAPHVVLAPLNIKDCANTCRWAVEIAESLQVPVIVLTDQMMGQAKVVVDAPDTSQQPVHRLRAEGSGEAYQRYKLLDTGVSPMSVPGDHGLQYTADGLEHNETGTPSSLASDHLKQSRKRRRKIEKFDYGSAWSEQFGEGDLLVLSWGSSGEVCQEAVRRLIVEGERVQSLNLRLLAPLPEQNIIDAIQGVKKCIVIELNESAQLFHYLKSKSVLPEASVSMCRPGPLFFRPGEIVKYVMEQIHAN